MDALIRREMTIDLVKAGIPASQIDEALTSAVSLASSGEIGPKEAVSNVVQAMLSFELGGPTETAQVRLSEPTGEDWELQLGAALGLHVAVLAILSPDSLIALPPSAFDLPEHPFAWVDGKVAVTHLDLDSEGRSQTLDVDGERRPWGSDGDAEDDKLVTVTTHDLPAGWRVIDESTLTGSEPRHRFVQDPATRLGPLPTS